MISVFCVKTLARKEPTGQTKNLSELNCLHANGITTFSDCLVYQILLIYFFKCTFDLLLSYSP